MPKSKYWVFVHVLPEGFEDPALRSSSVRVGLNTLLSDSSQGLLYILNAQCLPKSKYWVFVHVLPAKASKTRQ
jgi:hypothetical protein